MLKWLGYILLEPSLIHLARSLSYLEKCTRVGTGWAISSGVGWDMCLHETT